MQEASLILTKNSASPPDEQWWYFDVIRQGTFDGRLRLYAVVMEY